MSYRWATYSDLSAYESGILAKINKYFWNNESISLLPLSQLQDSIGFVLQMDEKMFDAMGVAIRTKYAGPTAFNPESLLLNVIMVQVWVSHFLDAIHFHTYLLPIDYLTLPFHIIYKIFSTSPVH